MRLGIVIAAGIAASLLYAAPGHAQQMRTWVSGTGDDADPCSRTAMCKTFAGALSKTAAGGEISVFDPGGFGSVTINKSISIVDVGAKASMLAAGTTGVTINAAPTDVVFLDGLVMEGGGSGTTGISIVSAKSVHIRNCVIRGFQSAPGVAISVAPSAATQVFVDNCAISNNSAGIQVQPSGGSAQVFLDRVQLENNAGSAVSVQGPNAVVRLNNSNITGNGVGLDIASEGSIITFRTSAISGNVRNGQASHVEPLQ